MADLQLAAAYAAGGEPPAQSFAPGRAQPPAAVPMEYKVEEGLPNVDDLEVAAAAAGVAPVPAALAELGYFELGPVPAPMKQGSESSSSGSSSEEESSSSSDEESGSDADEDAGDGGTAAAAAAATGVPVVRLKLEAVGEDSVTVQLEVLPSGAASGGVADMEAEAEVADDSSWESSSSSSGSSSDDEAESDEEGEGGEPLNIIKDYADIKKMIDDMDADVDADMDGGNAGTSGAHRAEAELLGSLPVPSLAALSISQEDAVQAAGTVQTMLEGMIVIKAQAGSRALSEGCVLVLEDRTPIGCIEEIFGPVVSPFYALRYAGAEPMPASLQQGATVYSVDRLAEFVLPEELRVKGYDAGLEEEDADVEAQFSDDEAEAEHRRKLKAKRKELPEGLQQQQQQPPGPRSGRQFPGGRGGRAGRGGGARGRGAGGGRGGQQQSPPQPQQQAFYHPHQQHVQPSLPQPQGSGRVFRGGLQRHQPAPPAAFQAHATAAQLTGMSLQQPAQQPHQQQGMGGFPGFVVHGYGGNLPGMPPPLAGQVLRPQYAVPAPQQRPPSMGAVMQAQYAGLQAGGLPPQYAAGQVQYGVPAMVQPILLQHPPGPPYPQPPPPPYPRPPPPQ